MAKDIETHIYSHTGVGEELDQAKIEEELNYEHYKARLFKHMCCSLGGALCGVHVLRKKIRFTCCSRHCALSGVDVLP